MIFFQKGSIKTVINNTYNKSVSLLDIFSELDINIQLALDNYFIYGGNEIILAENGGNISVYIKANVDCTLYPAEITASSLIASGDINLNIKRYFGATILKGTGELVGILNPNNLSQEVINGENIEIRFSPTFIDNGVEIVQLETNIISDIRRYSEAERGRRYTLKSGETIKATITNNSNKAISLLIVSSFSIK